MTGAPIGMARALVGALVGRGMAPRSCVGHAGDYIRVALPGGRVDVFLADHVSGEPAFVVMVSRDDAEDDAHAATFPMDQADFCALFIDAVRADLVSG